VENYERSIISQYDRSRTLRTWLEAFDQFIQPTKDLWAFHDFVWNVETAKGYGLDIWARIVGLGDPIGFKTSGRIVPIIRGEFWGYEEANLGGALKNPSAWPYLSVPPTDPEGGRPFWNGQYTNLVLPDDDDVDPSTGGRIPGFRRVILAKAATNIGDGSIGSMNHIINLLFYRAGGGNAYVRDNRDMTMTYVFDYQLSDIEQVILLRTGCMPKPAGVGIKLEINRMGKSIWDVGVDPVIPWSLWDRPPGRSPWDDEEQYL
jgi:hypothetical protein